MSAEKYISQGKEADIVDPDPNKIFTKRKLSKEGKLTYDVHASSSSSAIAAPITTSNHTKLKYPEVGWSNSRSRMPFFTRVEIDNHIRQSGKRLGSRENHSVPTSWRKGKTFLEDEYLKPLNLLVTTATSISDVNVTNPSKKTDKQHSLKLASNIITGEVVNSVCSCVAGKTGYCNHSLCLMLKLCKFSLSKC